MAKFITFDDEIFINLDEISIISVEAKYEERNGKTYAYIIIGFDKVDNFFKSKHFNISKTTYLFDKEKERINSKICGA